MSLLARPAQGDAGPVNPTTSKLSEQSGRLSLTRFVQTSMTPAAVKVAVVVLVGDLIFGLLRAVQLSTPYVQDPMFRLSMDGSYPEIFQYVKFFVIACLLGYLAEKKGVRWLHIWTVGFLFLLADDALLVHERIGAWLAPSIEPSLPAGVDAAAVAEFGYLGLVALVLFAVAAVGMVFSSGLFRPVSIDLILLLMLAGFFAVSVDLVHGLTDFGFVGRTLFSIVEDGGEMLGASLMTIYTVMVVDRRGDMPNWLAQVRRLRA